MKHTVTLFLLMFALAVGCTAMSEREQGIQTLGKEELYIVWAAIDLKEQDCVLKPEVFPAAALGPGQAFSVSVSGGGSRSTAHGRRVYLPLTVLPSVSVERLSQEAIEVEATLELDGEEYLALKRLKLEEGEHCLILLPEEGEPRFLFIFGIDTNTFD